ncbi:transmembrane protein 115-like [Planococcus citri]|uniref:transmembrane protein 115-like n=1 Tax=Planococcus citri TaxID=170843 RepID=UPI0031F8F002
MATSKIAKNFVYIKQQIAALLKSTSNTVKCIWLIVFVSYSFSFFETAVDVISVTPGYIVPPHFRIWSAFTFCFLELHFWNVLTDIVMIGLCGKVIEPLWGPAEIMSFFVVVNIGVALFSSIFYLFAYMCTSYPYYLFEVHIHGLSGYVAGVTVAVKQIMPDILIVKTPLGRITNRNMPLMVLFFSFVFWFVGISQSTNTVMMSFGVYVSWIYLRFYQRHSSGTIGDMSESFNFASFFPSIIQPYVGVLANTIFDLLVKTKICKKRVTIIDPSSDLTSVTVDASGVNHDKERRKQKALKALSEHLNKTDRPRVVGAVIPQKSIPSSPKKKIDSPPYSEDHALISTASQENEPLISNEQK